MNNNPQALVSNNQWDYLDKDEAVDSNSSYLLEEYKLNRKNEVVTGW
ncbi:MULTISPECIES: hypothetical protein [unclassified Bacillus (in: firmicutes)]|nr:MULTISPECIES: hypothetical protein [unclassified Bacillus (in: firmicutes)]